MSVWSTKPGPKSAAATARCSARTRSAPPPTMVWSKSLTLGVKSPPNARLSGVLPTRSSTAWGSEASERIRQWSCMFSSSRFCVQIAGWSFGSVMPSFRFSSSSRHISRESCVVQSASLGSCRFSTASRFFMNCSYFAGSTPGGTRIEPSGRAGAAANSRANASASGRATRIVERRSAIGRAAILATSRDPGRGRRYGENSEGETGIQDRFSAAGEAELRGESGAVRARVDRGGNAGGARPRDARGAGPRQAGGARPRDARSGGRAASRAFSDEPSRPHVVSQGPAQLASGGSRAGPRLRGHPRTRRGD